MSGRLRRGTAVRYEMTNHETWRGDGTVREGVVRDYVPEGDPNSFLTGEHYAVERTDGKPGRASGWDDVWPCEIRQVRRAGGWAGVEL